VPEDATVLEAVALLADRGISAASVIHETGRPVDVLSLADIVVHVRESGAHVERPGLTRVRDMMTPCCLLDRAGRPGQAGSPQATGEHVEANVRGSPRLQDLPFSDHTPLTGDPAMAAESTERVPADGKGKGAFAAQPSAGRAWPFGKRQSAGQLTVYWHSPMFYWWPVWVMGLVMAAWTFWEDHQVALFPEGAQLVEGKLAAPEGRPLVVPQDPPIHMTASRIPGALFVLTLIFTIFSVGGPLRAPWYFFITALAAAIVFAGLWLGAWPEVFEAIAWSRIYINAGGYLAISTAVLVYWLFFVLVVDRWTCVEFSERQIRIYRAIGEAVEVYDAGGVYFEKRPYDWVRWLVGGGVLSLLFWVPIGLLGLLTGRGFRLFRGFTEGGAGDLILKTSGAEHVILEMSNVLAVGRKLRKIEHQLQTQHVEE
jgi:hypothetical protein